jgi:hypothetical protein
MAYVEAAGGQADLDLGASGPFRYLTFTSFKRGSHFVASFGERLFEIRAARAGDVPCWKASIYRKDQPFAAKRKFFRELGDAQDFLEAEAARLGGAS